MKINNWKSSYVNKMFRRLTLSSDICVWKLQDEIEYSFSFQVPVINLNYIIYNVYTITHNKYFCIYLEDKVQ